MKTIVIRQNRKSPKNMIDNHSSKCRNVENILGSSNTNNYTSISKL
jgi:hypothetical protein